MLIHKPATTFLKWSTHPMRKVNTEEFGCAVYPNIWCYIYIYICMSLEELTRWPPMPRRVLQPLPYLWNLYHSMRVAMHSMVLQIYMKVYYTIWLLSLELLIDYNGDKTLLVELAVIFEPAAFLWPTQVERQCQYSASNTCQPSPGREQDLWPKWKSS